MLARTHGFEGQREAAITEARRSVEINPYDPFANNILGATLGLGSTYYQEAIPWFERALQLNPIDPQYHLYLTQLTLAELGAERYETASLHAQDAVRRNRDFLEAQIGLAAALGHLGDDLGNEIAYDGFDDVAVEYVRTHILYCQDLKDRLIDGLRKAGLAE